MFWLWVLCQWWCYMEYIYTVGLREVQIYPQLGYVIMSIIPAWWSSQTGGKHAKVNTINGFQRRPRVFSIILIIHYYSLVIKHSFENFPLTVANSKPFFFFLRERIVNLFVDSTVNVWHPPTQDIIFFNHSFSLQI